MTIDTRLRRAGFAYFESALLQDQGTRNIRYVVPRKRVPRRMIELLVKVLNDFEPRLLIVPDIRGRAGNRSKEVQRVFRAVIDEAIVRKIRIAYVSRAEINATFQPVLKGLRPNKQRINTTIAEWFPALRDRLPRKRKIWESEPHGQVLFNAVAMWCAWRGIPKKRL